MAELVNRRYRRERRYLPSRSISFEPSMSSALEAEADAANRTVSDVVRECITRGLPLVRDSRRKRGRQSRRNGRVPETAS